VGQKTKHEALNLKRSNPYIYDYVLKYPVNLSSM